MISWIREGRREKKNELLIYSRLSAGYNINSNKFDERMREKIWIIY
jgi:hypothetical protein